MTITLRSTKGSALTHAELDANFTDLDGRTGDGDKGDIVVTGSGTNWTIDSGVVTTTKLGGDITTAGKAILDDASASAQRTTLGFPAIGTDGYPLVPVSASTAYAHLPPGLGYNLVGGYLAWSVASNILTCAVKTWTGSDPSAAEPVFYAVRDVTAATGSLTYRKLTAALSVSLNNTALAGTVNSVAFRLWAVIFNDGGTDRLALINCLSTSAGAGAGRDVTSIYPLTGWGIASAVLSDNAADNALVFYANAAVSSKAYTPVGYAAWESGLATAGTWSAGPTRVQLYGPGVPLPGQTVQVQRSASGAVATGTTVLPVDDTIPQSTEGDQYLSQAITPTSATNAISIDTIIFISYSIANTHLQAALFQDATANALVATDAFATSATAPLPVPLRSMILAATTSATTFKVRAGGDAAGTMTLNGAAAGRRYGGVANSFLEVREVMA